MTSLLVAKQKIIVFFEKYDVYIMPVIKFLVALISLSVINSKLGYMEQINALPIVLIAALMCSPDLFWWFRRCLCCYIYTN